MLLACLEFCEMLLSLYEQRELLSTLKAISRSKEFLCQFTKSLALIACR